jgi:hypothetical protein
VALVILSACQSAAVGEEGDKEEGEETKGPAMGSVAGRLTATGIPSVLAMTHSVLVYTTQALFGQFYMIRPGSGYWRGAGQCAAVVSNHLRSMRSSAIGAGDGKLTTGFCRRCINRATAAADSAPVVKAVARAVKTN